MSDARKVDITGLMATPITNWEPRVKELCTPDNFEVEITGKDKMWRALNKSERQRLADKLVLVERYAQYMAAGMLKGTLKYPGDGYTLEQWMAHVVGEGADQSNYVVLMFDAWEREQAARRQSPLEE